MHTSRFVCALFLLGVAFAWEPNGAGLEPGSLPDKWTSGGPDCRAVPDWQVAEYNPDFLILRESGCAFYDKPFLYLIFGGEKALLFDSGGGNVVLAPTIQKLVAARAAKPVALTVIHSHSHGGHTAGDKQFVGLASVQVITHNTANISAAAGIAKWPDEIGSIDLGGRIVDIIPFPGHTVDSIAVYDRKTGNLLTGDSLFAGRLCVDENEFPEFTASTKRLARFAATYPIAHVLGGHIEQQKTAFVEYPAGEINQPLEHALPLSRAHIFELEQAVAAMNGTLVKAAFPEFTIVPEKACGPPPTPAKQ
jgi:glyoxylase-like metal-dependent hydrolase (beta-lactamase superfamily II)